jgi:hypothetical protein
VAASISLVLIVAWPLLYPKTWGWDRPTALAAGATSADYLNNLADAAEEWFAQTRDDSRHLARRLTEMRRGCDRLLAAPHAPLSQADRDWLLERCRTWSEKFDDQLAALQSGERSLQAVREEADATVKQLIRALRGRARRPEGVTWLPINPLFSGDPLA